LETDYCAVENEISLLNVSKSEHSPELLGVHEIYTIEVRNYTQRLVLKTYFWFYRCYLFRCRCLFKSWSRVV